MDYCFFLIDCTFLFLYVIGKDFIESKMVFSDILAKMWDEDDDFGLN